MSSLKVFSMRVFSVSCLEQPPVQDPDFVRTALAERAAQHCRSASMRATEPFRSPDGLKIPTSAPSIWRKGSRILGAHLVIYTDIARDGVLDRSECGGDKGDARKHGIIGDRLRRSFLASPMFAVCRNSTIGGSTASSSAKPFTKAWIQLEEALAYAR